MSQPELTQCDLYSGQKNKDPPLKAPVASNGSTTGRMAGKPAKKAYVRFDEYLDLSEENLRRSCKRLMNHLYCAPSFNSPAPALTASSIINSGSKPIDMAPSVMLASVSKQSLLVDRSPLGDCSHGESRKQVRPISPSLSTAASTSTSTASALASAKEQTVSAMQFQSGARKAGNRAPLSPHCGNSTSVGLLQNLQPATGVSLASARPISNINATTTTYAKSSGQSSINDASAPASSLFVTKAATSSSAKSYLQSQYERRLQRHSESIAKSEEVTVIEPRGWQSALVGADCLRGAGNRLSDHGDRTGAAAGTLPAPKSSQTSASAPGPAGAPAGPNKPEAADLGRNQFCMDKQDTLSRSHELSKRRFFEKLEQRDLLLKRNPEYTNGRLCDDAGDGGNSLGASDSNNRWPMSGHSEATGAEGSYGLPSLLDASQCRRRRQNNYQLSFGRLGCHAQFEQSNANCTSRLQQSYSVEELARSDEASCETRSRLGQWTATNAASTMKSTDMLARPQVDEPFVQPEEFNLIGDSQSSLGNKSIGRRRERQLQQQKQQQLLLTGSNQNNSQLMCIQPSSNKTEFRSIISRDGGGRGKGEDFYYDDAGGEPSEFEIRVSAANLSHFSADSLDGQDHNNADTGDSLFKSSLLIVKQVDASTYSDANQGCKFQEAAETKATGLINHRDSSRDTRLGLGTDNQTNQHLMNLPTQEACNKTAARVETTQPGASTAMVRQDSRPEFKSECPNDDSCCVTRTNQPILPATGTQTNNNPNRLESTRLVSHETSNSPSSSPSAAFPADNADRLITINHDKGGGHEEHGKSCSSDCLSPARLGGDQTTTGGHEREMCKVSAAAAALADGQSQRGTKSREILASVSSLNERRRQVACKFEANFEALAGSRAHESPETGESIATVASLAPQFGSKSGVGLQNDCSEAGSANDIAATDKVDWFCDQLVSKAADDGELKWRQVVAIGECESQWRQRQEQIRPLCKEEAAQTSAQQVADRPSSGGITKADPNAKIRDPLPEAQPTAASYAKVFDRRSLDQANAVVISQASGGTVGGATFFASRHRSPPPARGSEASGHSSNENDYYKAVAACNKLESGRAGVTAAGYSALSGHEYSRPKNADLAFGVEHDLQLATCSSSDDNAPEHKQNVHGGGEPSKQQAATRPLPLIESLFLRPMSFSQSQNNNKCSPTGSWSVRNSKSLQVLPTSKLIEDDGGSSCSSSGFGASSSSDGCAGSIKKNPLKVLHLAANIENRPSIDCCSSNGGGKLKCEQAYNSALNRNNYRNNNNRPSSLAVIGACESPASFHLDGNEGAQSTVYDCVRSQKLARSISGQLGSANCETSDESSSNRSKTVVGPGQAYPPSSLIESSYGMVFVENQNYATFVASKCTTTEQANMVKNNDNSCDRSNSIVCYANLEQHQAEYAAAMAMAARMPRESNMDSNNRQCDKALGLLPAHQGEIKNSNSDGHLSERGGYSSAASSSTTDSGGFSALRPATRTIENYSPGGASLVAAGSVGATRPESATQKSPSTLRDQRKQPSLLKRFGSLVSRALTGNGGGTGEMRASSVQVAQKRPQLGASETGKLQALPLDNEPGESKVNECSSGNANVVVVSACSDGSSFRAASRKSGHHINLRAQDQAKLQQPKVDLVILPAKCTNKVSKPARASRKQVQQQAHSIGPMKLWAKNDDRLSRETRRAGRKSSRRLSVSESVSLDSESGSSSSSAWTSYSSSEASAISSLSSVFSLDRFDGYHRHDQKQQPSGRGRSFGKPLERASSLAEDLNSLMSESEFSNNQLKRAKAKSSSGEKEKSLKTRQNKQPVAQTTSGRRIVDIDSVSPSIKRDNDNSFCCESGNSELEQRPLLATAVAQSKQTNRNQETETCGNVLPTRKHIYNRPNDAPNSHYAELRHPRRLLEDQDRRPRPLAASKRFDQDRYQQAGESGHSLHKVNQLGPAAKSRHGHHNNHCHHRQVSSSHHTCSRYRHHHHHHHHHRNNRQHQHHRHRHHHHHHHNKRHAHESRPKRTDEAERKRKRRSSVGSPVELDSDARLVWGLLIKINKSDGSQIIKLQRSAGNAWGFCIARGSLNEIKGLFISRLDKGSSLTGLLSLGDRVLAINGQPIEHDQDVLQVNKLISKKSKLLLKVKPSKG